MARQPVLGGPAREGMLVVDVLATKLRRHIDFAGRAFRLLEESPLRIFGVSIAHGASARSFAKASADV